MQCLGTPLCYLNSLWLYIYIYIAISSQIAREIGFGLPGWPLRDILLSYTGKGLYSYTIEYLIRILEILYLIETLAC